MPTVQKKLVRFADPLNAPPLARAAGLARSILQWTGCATWNDVLELPDRTFETDEAAAVALSRLASIRLTPYERDLLAHYQPLLRLLREGGPGGAAATVTIATCTVCGPPGPYDLLPAATPAADGSADRAADRAAGATSVDPERPQAPSQRVKRVAPPEGDEGGDWIDEASNVDVDALLNALTADLAPDSTTPTSTAPGGTARGAPGPEGAATSARLAEAPTGPSASDLASDLAGAQDESSSDPSDEDLWGPGPTERGLVEGPRSPLRGPDGVYVIGSGWMLLGAGAQPGSKCLTTWRCPGSPVKAPALKRIEIDRTL